MNEMLERLLVTIEGSSELLRQELQKGGQSVDQFARNTDARLGTINNSMAKMGAALRSTLAAFGVGFGATALVNFTRGAIQAADAVGETARQAGFGAERFQRLQFVFRQNGVEAGEFESAMRAANTRLGQFITTGAGPAAKAIEQLGLKQRIASGEIRTNEQLVDALIGTLGKVPSSAERAALAAAFFGREAGAKLAAALALGEKAINSAAEAATGIFTDETSRKADAIADAFERFNANIVRAAAVAATFDIGRLLGIDEVVKQFDSLESQIARLEHQRTMAAGNERAGLGVVRSSASIEAEIAALKEYQRLLNTPFIQNSGQQSSTIPETDTERRARLQIEQLMKGAPVNARRISSLADLRAQREALGFETLSLDPLLTGVTTGRARRASSADDIFAARRAQRGGLGLREFPMNEAAIERMREYGEVVEKAQERQKKFADAIAASFESRGMESLLNGRPRDAIRGLAKDFAELVIRIGVLQPLAEKLAKTMAGIGSGSGSGGSGGGFFATIFGSLFSGAGFASGGRPPVGKASWVGEKGRELWVPDVPGRIYSHAQSMRMAAAGAGGPVIHYEQHNQVGIPAQWAAQQAMAASQVANLVYEAVIARLSGVR